MICTTETVVPAFECKGSDSYSDSHVWFQLLRSTLSDGNANTFPQGKRTCLEYKRFIRSCSNNVIVKRSKVFSIGLFSDERKAMNFEEVKFLDVALKMQQTFVRDIK